MKGSDWVLCGILLGVAALCLAAIALTCVVTARAWVAWGWLAGIGFGLAAWVFIVGFVVMAFFGVMAGLSAAIGLTRVPPRDVKPDGMRL